MHDSSKVYVLDPWPIMEWIQNRQPSTGAIDQLLALAIQGKARLLISDINYGEVLYSYWRKFSPQEASRVLADIEALPIETVAVKHSHVEEASRTKAVVSASYPDCFAAALALHRNAQLVTGDPEMLRISSVSAVQLHWLGA